MPKIAEMCHIYPLPQGREAGKWSSHKHSYHTFDSFVMGLVVFTAYSFRPLRAKRATVDLHFPQCTRTLHHVISKIQCGSQTHAHKTI